MKKLFKLFLSFFLCFSLIGCTVGSTDTGSEKTSVTESIDENGSYTSKDEVALYLHTYGHLPSNYITKKEAQALGWESSKGNLWDVAPGKSIGGDYYGNYEGVLPEDDSYHECDIDYKGGKRNGKRIVYGKSGAIYYTEDHYSTFTELYGD